MKRLLHGVQLIAICNTFDGCNFSPVNLCGKKTARFYGLAIEVNNTGPALAGVTANMGAS
jgi:hypothetical protein